MLSLKTIVVPTDFSERSLRALPYAVGLAETFGARLKIVFVNVPGLKVSDLAWVGVDLRALSREHLDEAMRHMKEIVLKDVPKGVTADTEILDGEPVSAISTYAAKTGADLIVMTTHGLSGVLHLLMGSTAEGVVRKAPCPVLTLKEPK